jgi:hypothetical protein
MGDVHEVRDSKKLKKERGEQPQKNFEREQVRGQSILLFAKSWEPFDASNKKVVGTQEEGYARISQLVNFILKLLDKISRSKSRVVAAQTHGTWTLLTSLFHLSNRFEGIFKATIAENLSEIKRQFDRTAKKIIKETEVRVAQGILDVVNVILRSKGSQADEIFMAATEGRSVGADLAPHPLAVQFLESLALYRLRYDANDIDVFVAHQRFTHRQCLNGIYFEYPRVRLPEPQLITGICDLLQVTVKHIADPIDRQIIFLFKITNATTFLLENLTLDFEMAHGLTPVPHETSKTFFVKALSTRQVIDWACTFKLTTQEVSLDSCRLRIQMPPNESCPTMIGASGEEAEEDLVFYSIGFGLRPLDLLMPDRVHQYELASIKFSQYFTDLPHQI